MICHLIESRVAPNKINRLVTCRSLSPCEHEGAEHAGVRATEYSGLTVRPLSVRVSSRYSRLVCPLLNVVCSQYLNNGITQFIFHRSFIVWAIRKKYFSSTATQVLSGTWCDCTIISICNTFVSYYISEIWAALSMTVTASQFSAELLPHRKAARTVWPVRPVLRRRA